MMILLLSGGFWNPFIKMEPPGSIAEMTGRILGIIQVIAVAITVGMLLYIGIKYMLSAADEKANLKQASINYIIGAFIVFAAPSLFRIIIDVVYTMVN